MIGCISVVCIHYIYIYNILEDIELHWKGIKSCKAMSGKIYCVVDLKQRTLGVSVIDKTRERDSVCIYTSIISAIYIFWKSVSLILFGKKSWWNIFAINTKWNCYFFHLLFSGFLPEQLFCEIEARVIQSHVARNLYSVFSSRCGNTRNYSVNAGKKTMLM